MRRNGTQEQTEIPAQALAQLGWFCGAGVRRRLLSAGPGAQLVRVGDGVYFQVSAAIRVK